LNQLYSSQKLKNCQLVKDNNYTFFNLEVSLSLIRLLEKFLILKILEIMKNESI